MAALAALSGCGRPSPDTAAGQVDPGNPLEVAARERGIIREQADDLTGVFERRHELGRDALCVVSDGEGQWYFSLTAAFGPGLSCTGNGPVTRVKSGWKFHFAGITGCDVVMSEREDELRMPGNLPDQCRTLCPSRASLAGLRLPRASWSVDDARRLQMRDRSGKIIRPCAQ